MEPVWMINASLEAAFASFENGEYMAIHGGDIYNNRIEYDFSVNLNPYERPDSINDVVLASIDRINVYPDINQERVRNSLAETNNITKDMTLAGNGASELIMAVTRAVNPKRVLIIEPSFYGYRHAVTSLTNCEIQEYICSKENEFNITEEVLDSINASVDLLFLANPGNPVGKTINEDLLERIIDRAYENNSYILLDESFIYLSDKMLDCNYKNSISKWINKNVFILRSFTKLFAMPGVRAGFVISSEENIRKVKKQLPEWNLSNQAEAALIEGARIIRETNFVKDSCEYIRKERQYMIQELSKMSEYKVVDSDTTFILIKTEIDLYQSLLKEGILIRDCSNYKGLTGGYYRIAIKRREDNNRIVNALMNQERTARGY